MAWWITRDSQRGDVDGDALTAANTGAGNAVLLTSRLKLTRQGVGDADTRGTERMADGDSATPDVEPSMSAVKTSLTPFNRER